MLTMMMADYNNMYDGDDEYMMTDTGSSAAAAAAATAVVSMTMSMPRPITSGQQQHRKSTDSGYDSMLSQSSFSISSTASSVSSSNVAPSYCCIGELATSPPGSLANTPVKMVIHI